MTQEVGVDGTTDRDPTVPEDGRPAEAAPEPSAGAGDHPEPADDAITIADGELRPVDPAWVTVQRIASGIATAAMLIPATVAATLVIFLVPGLPGIAAAGIGLGVLVLWAVLLWSALVLPGLRYRHLRYAVDPGGLTIRGGIWWRSDVRVPRSRVQHTDVNQGPLDRAHDVATLVVFTAGTEHARVALDGLPAERASRIRDFLVESGAGDGV